MDENAVRCSESDWFVAHESTPHVAAAVLGWALPREVKASAGAVWRGSAGNDDCKFVSHRFCSFIV